MTFKFKHTLAVILAVVTVACSVVGTLAVSAAETDSQPATEESQKNAIYNKFAFVQVG